MGRLEPRRYPEPHADWTPEERQMIVFGPWRTAMLFIQDLPETEHPGIRYAKGPELRGWPQC